MMRRLVNKLLTLRAWELVVLGVVVAETVTAASNVVLSLMRWGDISAQMLRITIFDTFVASVIVSPIVIYLARYSTRLYFETEVLRGEIEERRRLEERLRLMHKAVLTTNIGITITDNEGAIVFTNPADARMHGYEPHELIGRSALIYAPPGVRKRPMDMRERKSVRHWVREGVNLRKDGGTFPVRLISDAVSDEHGEPIGMVTTCEDITERVERDREREALLMHKDMFIGRLGHDIKTPLTPLVTLLPIIAERTADEETGKLLDVAQQSVNTMKELIVKTLKLARASSPSKVSQEEDLNLRELTDKYVSKRRFIIEKARLSVYNRISADTWVRADRNDLEEVYYNLISNAVKYTPEGGQVELEARPNGPMIVASARDTGIGLTEAEAARVFDEFYKVDESRHELDSSGLGLSICRKIVERAGGRIWAESPGKGLGTTIYFSLRAGRGPEGAS